MTKQPHPITPPPELVHKWALEAEDEHQPTVAYSLVGQIATKAAQWGSDQELEACCEWLFDDDYDVAPVCLRAARRPKPPSLKDQALEALERMDQLPTTEDKSTIRRALEALDD